MIRLQVSQTDQQQVEIVICRKLSDPQLLIHKTIIVLPEAVSADLEAFATGLIDRLQDFNVEVETASLNDFASFKGKVVISLLEAESPLIHDMNSATLKDAKAFFMAKSRGGVWVTRGNAYVEGNSDPISCYYRLASSNTERST
jgi:hypothetical protein